MRLDLEHTQGGYMMAKREQQKDILTRLKRIEGQIRGLQRMVEEGFTCQDILTQVAAATGAMKKVGRIIVQTYLEECLDRTRKESGTKKGETFRDLQMAISRYINWA